RSRKQPLRGQGGGSIGGKLHHRDFGRNERHDSVHHNLASHRRLDLIEDRVMARIRHCDNYDLRGSSGGAIVFAAERGSTDIALHLLGGGLRFLLWPRAPHRRVTSPPPTPFPPPAPLPRSPPGPDGGTVPPP